MALFAISMLLGVALVGLIPETEPEGTDASEKYTGTAQDDAFSARGGNDLLIGLDGDDTLTGDEGDDWLIGLNGQDRLIGDAGKDVLIGGDGEDTLNGGAGDDFVESANIVEEELLTQTAKDANTFSDIELSYDLPNVSDEGDQINLGTGDDTAVIGSDDTLASGSGEDRISLGDWVEDGKPVVIEDFESTKDLLIYTYQRDATEPVLSLHYDEENQVTELRADGQITARLENTLGDISLHDIRLTTYVA